MKPVLYVNTTRMPFATCKSCGKVIDAATGANQQPSRPKPGSLSICTKCYAIGVYDELLDVQPISEEFLAELKKEKPTWRVIELIIKNLKQRGKAS